MTRLRKGFTLIELLIAIAIVAILVTATVSLVNPLEQFKKGRDAQRKQDLRQLQIALEAFNADNNKYPELYNLFGGADPWGQPWLPYMVKIPKDPKPTQTYYYSQPVDATGANDTTRYTLFAKLERCPDPQMIPGAACTDPYTYAVASSNIAIAPFPTPPPLPTPTPTPLPIKRVFVTSSTRNGNFAGLTGADSFCNTLANNAALGGTWTAWFSTTSPIVHAKDRVPNAEYRLVNNTTVIANNKDDLTDGTIDNPINKNESNVLVGSGSVWTGTHENGIGDATCTNWTTDASGVTGDGGDLAQATSSWTAAGHAGCNLLFRLYCFEQ